MELNELNLDVRTYNAVKRADFETAEQLVQAVETERFAQRCGRNAVKSVAQALKSAGLVQYIRGDDVPAEQLGCELEFEELAGHIGEILAVDISTESHKWYRAVVICKITDDRILYSDSYKKDYLSSESVKSYHNRKRDKIRSGGFFLIRSGAAPAESVPAEIISAEEAAPAEDAHEKAMQLHRRIKADWEIAAESIWDMGQALKEMRDGKHYKALLYDNFEGYCECELQMSRPQAYRYIGIVENMTEENVSSMRQIGMTKLALLATVTEEQRQEIIETVDLDSTTVRELKAQIEALKHQSESAEAALKDAEGRAQKWYEEAESKGRQLTEQHAKWVKSENQRTGLEAKLGLMQQQIDELESRPIEVAVQTDDAALEQLRQAHLAEIAQLKAKHQEQLAKVQQADASERIIADIRQGQFDAKHSVMQTAADDLMTFLAGMEMSGNPQAAAFIEHTKKTLRKITNRLNEIIMEGENAE